MNRRLVLAVALSMMVWIFFQRFTEQPAPQPQEQRETRDEAEPESPAVRPLSPEETPFEPGPEHLTVAETDRFKLFFSDRGATLKALVLKETEYNPRETLLFEVEEAAKRPFALSSDLIPRLYERTFELSRSDGLLEYIYEEPYTARVVKRFFLDPGEQHIRLEIDVENLSTARLPMAYTITGPSALERSEEIFGRDLMQADVLIDNKLWKERRATRPEERTGHVNWAALKERYHAVILKPLDRLRAARIEKKNDKDIVLSLKTHTEVMPPQDLIRHEYLLYAGPLNERLLERYGYGMEKVVDYGFFGMFSRILLGTMRFLHGVLGNWGVAIIVLSLLINLLLFPLSIKSFTSMHRMRAVQPHIEKLRALHKDNPQKLNKETMELYRKHNINPLGGCLPMLLQMPVFIGLYQGLLRAIELKGARFLWVGDLARPDAFMTLPFSIPFFGDSLNLLPLIMIAAMMAQQKISQPATQAPAEGPNPQQSMMIIMPLVFGVLFYQMPAGLVLYWLTNTVFMTAAQAMISRKLAT